MPEAGSVWMAGILVTGIGATAATDLWAIARARLLGVPPLDYAMVGRWVGHMARGRFRHASIAAAAPVRGERATGWAVHYLTGIAFAGLLPLVWGPGWFLEPTPGPAMIVGLGSVLAPFLVMQPALGAGLAARRTPDPARARLHSLLTHGVFGLGLYASGLVFSHAI
jgi:hypothetical protein